MSSAIMIDGIIFTKKDLGVVSDKTIKPKMTNVISSLGLVVERGQDNNQGCYLGLYPLCYPQPPLEDSDKIYVKDLLQDIRIDVIGYSFDKVVQIVDAFKEIDVTLYSNNFNTLGCNSKDNPEEIDERLANLINAVAIKKDIS